MLFFFKNLRQILKAVTDCWNT